MKINPITSIRKLKPYVPPLDGRRGYRGLLLDFNERVGLAPNNLYPEYGQLRTSIADYCDVTENQILITAGAGAGISLIFRAYCEIGDTVIVPKPSFELLFQAARIAGASIISPTYDAITGTFPLTEVLDVNVKPKIIVICNPNNPTGSILDISAIAQIATTYSRSLVMVDEAYFEYSNVTAVELIKSRPNIVVLRTFSKAFGLAALRVGYIVACADIIATLLKVNNPYDVAMPSALVATQSMKDVKSMKSYIDELMNESKQFIENFFTDYGIPFYASAANFVCFKTQDNVGTFDKLAAKKILIRKVDNDSKLRVTVGTLTSAKLFVQVFKEILNSKPLDNVAFIDRDGTMIFEPQDTFQVDELDQLVILPRVIKGLKALQAQGFCLVMVSNQNGIGTPSFPRAKFLSVQNALLMRLAQSDIYFDRVFICPHFPADKCDCRKPQTTLVADILKQYSINKERSIMIGDRETDVQFASNLGIPMLQMATNGDFPLLTLNERLEQSK